MRPKTLDHVAFWVEDRDAIAGFATDHLGMHVIERTERFTLVGSDARHGKLTLFAADGARERGAFKHVALRVSDLGAARAALPDGAGDELELADGLRIRLVEAPTSVEYDLDHVALFSPDPRRTAADYGQLGFAPAEPSNGTPRVEVGGAFVEFHEGDPGDPERPLLNHVAVLVDSAEQHIDEAKELGIEIDDIVDAPNTYAVFLRGPERVRIEYVEHKPTFSLR
ncbi:MAG: VOC family protein [Actinomycetota bacterium]|nr:VOC family protein [Actinomycetota bacterium]